MGNSSDFVSNCLPWPNWLHNKSERQEPDFLSPPIVFAFRIFESSWVVIGLTDQLPLKDY